MHWFSKFITTMTTFLKFSIIYRIQNKYYIKIQLFEVIVVLLALMLFWYSFIRYNLCAQSCFFSSFFFFSNTYGKFQQFFRVSAYIYFFDILATLPPINLFNNYSEGSLDFGVLKQLLSCDFPLRARTSNSKLFV